MKIASNSLVYSYTFSNKINYIPFGSINIFQDNSVFSWHGSMLDLVIVNSNQFRVKALNDLVVSEDNYHLA